MIIFFITIGFVSAVYAEGAGLRVNYKNVKVSITYNDNVDDQISGVEYIRQNHARLHCI